MRLTTTGLGIGTSAPGTALDVYSAANGIIRVGGGSSANQGGGFYVANPGVVASTLAAFGDRARIMGGTPGQAVSIYTAGSVPLLFDVGTGTKATIDASGNLLVGTTTAAPTNSNSFYVAPSVGAVGINHISGSASGNTYAAFSYNGSPVGSVTQNGTTGIAVSGGSSTVYLGASVSTTTPIATPGYTVSTLPSGMPTGARAYVTDANTCTFLGALTGGGSTFCPVVYNGSAWVGG